MGYRKSMIAIGIGLLLITLVGCGTPQAAYELAAENTLPDFLDASKHEVREAYRFAIANHDELETVPCYCGCTAMGHLNNFDCYIQEVKGDGEIIFDEHASRCGVCVDITQDVMRLKRIDRSPVEIRAFIDDKYSKFGPGTDTPLPSA